MTMIDRDGKVALSAHVAIWLVTMVFFAGIFIATLEARSYVDDKLRVERLDYERKLEKIEAGIDRINGRLDDMFGIKKPSTNAGS